MSSSTHVTFWSRVMPFLHANVNKLLVTVYTEGNKSYETYIKVDHAADLDHSLEGPEKG